MNQTPIILGGFLVLLLIIVFIYNPVYSVEEQDDGTKSDELHSHDNEYPKQPFSQYIPYMQGPEVGKPLGVPVPAGSLKETNEEYYGRWYSHHPYHYPSHHSFHHVPHHSSFPFIKHPLPSHDYFKPFGLNENVNDSAEYSSYPLTDSLHHHIHYPMHFISSVNAFMPGIDVDYPWEKIGLLNTVDETDDTILNLYRKPVAPLQDLYEYSIQDKDGFVAPLKGLNYIEDGDVINPIEGREVKGKWVVRIYTNNKYVYM